MAPRSLDAGFSCRLVLLVGIFGLALSLTSPAAAQGGPVVDAAPLSSAGSGASAGSAGSAGETRPARSAPGPSVRERGGRRSRGSSMASGALFLAVLIGAMGYYVVRRLRR